MRKIFFILIISFIAYPKSTQKDLEYVFSQGQWNEVVQMAYELVHENPKNADAKLKSGYALFQLGFSNAALILLKKITSEEWKKLPQGKDRFVEIVSLFQKKVPINLLPGRIEQVNETETSEYLLDEVLFAKGRSAFENGNNKEAYKYLSQIKNSSRFYTLAHYLLGSIAIQTQDYVKAKQEFTIVLEPRVLEQSSEFWKDIGTQVSHNWGTSLSVMIDSETIAKTSQLSELALMALARIAYATRDYSQALNIYNKISENSKWYPRSQLEKVWTLLALDRHAEAEKAAGALSLRDNSFEAIESRTIRAIILTDSKRTNEARDELGSFTKVYDKYQMGLSQYLQKKNEDVLPQFVLKDFSEDIRLQSLETYKIQLKKEIDTLDIHETKYTVFSQLASQLSPLLTEANQMIEKFKLDHVKKRIQDIDTLNLQSKLILSETYLEDREKLRDEFLALKSVDEKKQEEHDKRLVELLEKAAVEIEESRNKIKLRHLNLEFRQSELLWELSRARAILSHTSNKKENEEIAEKYRKRSVEIAENFSRNYTKHEKHPQALFFTGFAQIEMGKEAEGLRTLTEYTKLYPKHAHASDAYRILADNLFDKNKFREAQEVYRKILDFENSPIVGYSLYKIGWSAYNMKDFAKAMLALEKAILWARHTEGTHTVFNLKREARRDLIAIYAEVGSHEKAREYFDRFFRDDTYSWLVDLAREYETTGQFEKSNLLYQSLIEQKPEAKENIQYMLSIVQGTYKLHQWDKVLLYLKEFQTRFGKIVSEIKTEQTALNFQAEQSVRELVLGHHFEFKTTLEDSIQQRGVELSELYLSMFENWPAAQTPMYHYAHLLLKTDKLLESAQVFKKHWLTYQATLQEPIREEALRNVIHSFEKVEEKIKVSEPVKVSISAEELLFFSKEYARLYSTTKYARPIAYLQSVILYKYLKEDEGMALSQRLFDEDHKDEFGKKSFNNLRVAYYNKKNWEATYQWARKLYEKFKVTQDSFVGDVKNILEESLFLWAQNTESNDKSAEIFLNLVKDPEMGRLRSKALFNAFVRYQKQDNKIQALKLASDLEKLDPHFSQLTETYGIRAAYYQEAGDYEKAYPLLEAFLKNPPKEVSPEIIQQARLNCGLMAEGVSNTQRALALFKQYLENSKKIQSNGVKEAEKAIARIEKRGPREVASVAPKNWEALLQLKNQYEKSPISKKGELPTRIQKSLQKLEEVANKLLEVSVNPKTSPKFAFESYCAVPFVYESYEKALLKISEEPQFLKLLDLKVELEKLALPIRAKASELANQCLKQAMNAEHTGEYFYKVLKKWGWHKDEEKLQKVVELRSLLEKASPFWDPPSLQLKEEEIFKEHLENKASPHTWYLLSFLRWKQNKLNLSRLTLIDAISHDPEKTKIGRYLNGLAVIEAKKGFATSMVPLYEGAVNMGSVAASANLALYYLRLDNLDAAKKNLRQIFDTEFLKDDPKAVALTKELLNP